MSSADEHEQLADEIRQQLIASGERPRDLTPLPGQRERAEALLAQITSTPAPDAGASPITLTTAPGSGSTRTWLRRGLLLTAAASVAVAALLLRPGSAPEVAQAITPAMLHFQGVKQGTLPRSGEPAAGILSELADLADSQPAPEEGPVQRVIVEGWWSATDDDTVESVLLPVRNTNYYFPDGTMRQVSQRGEQLDDQGRVVDVLKLGPLESDETFMASDLGPGYADDLPRDPIGLRKTLEASESKEACEEAPGGCLLWSISSLATSYVIDPDLTASLWRMLATEPSVTYLGQTTERLRRPAHVFTTPGVDEDIQELLLVDPETGALLGTEQILVTESDAYGFEPPAVVEFTAIVSAERIGYDEVPSSP